MSSQATAASSMYGSSNSSAAGSAASGAQSAPAAGGAAKAAPPIDGGELVYNVNLVFIMVFGAFVLTMMPRMLATLARPAHFFTAFLRGPSKGEYTGAPAREYGSARRVDFNGKGMESDSAFSHYNSQESSTAHLVQYPRPVAPQSASGAPPRVRSWLTYTHPTIVYALNNPFLPGVTLSKAIVYLGYMGLVLFATFDGSDFFSQPKRTGYVAMAQIPIVVALATKNNVLSWLSGEGYEKLNYIHRFGGRLAILASNLHGFGYIYKWAQAGTFYEDIAIPKFTYGLMALCAMDLFFLGSLAIVRQKCYSLFLFSHIVGFACLSVALYQHYSVTWNYIYAALGVYGFDLLLRTMRTRATTAYVTAHESLNNGTTHVHMPAITKGFRAGQHVRVRFVNPDSGAFGWIMALLFARTRPFSISSKPAGSGLELLIKKEGSSTRELFKMAGGGARSMDEKAVNVELGQVSSRRVKVLVEGPYSGHAATMFEAYSGALLVAGGSGISFILSLLDDLVNKHVEGRSRTRAIEVVWSVGDANSLIELLPILRPLLRPRLSPDGNFLRVQMTVHYTRASGAPLPDLDLLPEGLYLRAGRPDISRSLKATVQRTVDATQSGGRSEAQGVVASCCGPPALGEQINKALGGLDYTLWKQVGGVEIASETFGW